MITKIVQWFRGFFVTNVVMTPEIEERLQDAYGKTDETR